MSEENQTTTRNSLVFYTKEELESKSVEELEELLNTINDTICEYVIIVDELIEKKAKEVGNDIKDEVIEQVEEAKNSISVVVNANVEEFKEAIRQAKKELAEEEKTVWDNICTIFDGVLKFINIAGTIALMYLFYYLFY